MRELALKLGATCVTLLATVMSAAYVTSHLKNSAAPLHPSVLSSSGQARLPAGGDSLAVGPSVAPTDQSPVTSTYAS